MSEWTEPQIRTGLRNTWILLAAQPINGSFAVANISLGGLAGAYLLGGDRSLATLPVAAFSVGLALGAFPAAVLMQRIGRRNGLMAGTLFAVAGGLIAAAALSGGSFWIFTLGLVLGGISATFVQQSRFAAAESVPPNLRGIAISRVLIGGILTAVIAPQIVLLTRDLFSSTPFAGSFVAMAVMAIVGAGVLSLLRFPRAAGERARQSAADALPARPLGEIAIQPRFLVALLCGAVAYALMAFVMTAAPLAMVDHHHSEADAVLGIQWHVLAMFVPSLVTGRLITRFGKETIVAAGLLLLILSALVGIAGVELLHFWAMLIVLGVGWNFAFIGATTMLTDTYTAAEKGRVEGLNDAVIFGSVAIASLSSGAVLNDGGWNTINIIVLPAAAIVLLVLFIQVVRGRRSAA